MSKDPAAMWRRNIPPLSMRLYPGAGRSRDGAVLWLTMAEGVGTDGTCST